MVGSASLRPGGRYYYYYYYYYIYIRYTYIQVLHARTILLYLLLLYVGTYVAGHLLHMHTSVRVAMLILLYNTRLLSFACVR